MYTREEDGLRYLLLAVAVLTCPCHLPIWIPVLSTTALGAMLSRHTGLAAIALTAVFVVSAWASLRLFFSRRRLP